MQASSPRKLYRSNRDRVICGVCGGIGEYFDIAPWGVRLVWVLLTVVAWPFMIIAYIAMAFAFKPADAQEFSPAHHEPKYDLASLQVRFQSLDRRISRIESVVTRPSFSLEEDYRRL